MGDWQQEPEIRREPVIDYSILRKELVTRFMNCKLLAFANEDIALGYRAALGDILEYLGDD